MLFLLILRIEQDVHEIDAKVGLRVEVVIDMFLWAQDLIVDVMHRGVQKGPEDYRRYMWGNCSPTNRNGRSQPAAQSCSNEAFGEQILVHLDHNVVRSLVDFRVVMDLVVEVAVVNKPLEPGFKPRHMCLYVVKYGTVQSIV